MKLREGRCGSFKDKLYFVWHVILKPKKFLIMAGFAILLSIMLVVGEMIILLEMQYSLFGLIP
jgi:hypothetical protein